MQNRNITRPMKAVDVERDGDGVYDLTTVTYPILASPKLDGIRCLRPHDMGVVTTSFNPIPNHYIRQKLNSILPEGFDGEIILPGKDYNSIQSEVMSYMDEPDFEFHAFDYVKETIHEPFYLRLANYSKAVREIDSRFLKAVPCRRIRNISELKEYEQFCLESGFEGVMLRSINGEYKNGRSTLSQGLLLKLKRFYEDEGIITGFVPLHHNKNAKKLNKVGLTQRTSHQKNKLKAETLGSFILDWRGRTLKCGTGTGLTHKLRQQYWNEREALLGKMVTFKYQKHGMKHVPRLPTFRGIRRDLTQI